MFKEIRKTTVEKLKALSVPVHDSKVTPNFLTSLPCICVYSANFNGTGQQVRPTFNWNLELQVDVLVSAVETTYADQAEDLVQGVIDSLMSDQEWVDQFGDIENVSCSYNYFSDGQKPVVTAEIKIQASKFGAY